MLRRCLLLAVLGLGVAAPAAEATISVSAPSVGEGGTLTFTVARDNPLETASADTADGTATAPGDYTARSNVPVAFGLGMTAEVTVQTVQDGAPEPDETVRLVVDGTLSDPVTGVGTITDDDPPELAVFDARSSEATGFVDIPVGRTLISRPTRVVYTVTPGSASAADLGATSGEITIPPNAGAATIRVPVVNDTDDEEDEAFSISIAAPDGGTVVHAAAVGTITNDDVRAISVADATVTEGDGAATLVRVPVTLSAPTTRTITAQYATANVTARSGSDYASRIGTLTFAPGTTQAFIDVAIVSDDKIEKPEQFAIFVGRQTNATTARGFALVRITDDDAAQGDDVAPNVKVTTPKRSGSRISLKVTCPKGERTCRSRVALYTRPDRTSKVRSLRRERRIAGRTIRLNGGRSRTVKLTVPKSLRSAARRARRLKVRAFVVTTDANDNQDTTEKNATLRFR